MPKIKGGPKSETMIRAAAQGSQAAAGSQQELVRQMQQRQASAEAGMRQGLAQAQQEFQHRDRMALQQKQLDLEAAKAGFMENPAYGDERAQRLQTEMDKGGVSRGTQMPPGEQGPPAPPGIGEEPTEQTTKPLEYDQSSRRYIQTPEAAAAAKTRQYVQRRKADAAFATARAAEMRAAAAAREAMAKPFTDRQKQIREAADTMYEARKPQKELLLKIESGQIGVDDIPSEILDVAELDPTMKRAIEGLKREDLMGEEKIDARARLAAHVRQSIAFSQLKQIATTGITPPDLDPANPIMRQWNDAVVQTTTAWQHVMATDPGRFMAEDVTPQDMFSGQAQKVWAGFRSEDERIQYLGKEAATLMLSQQALSNVASQFQQPPRATMTGAEQAPPEQAGGEQAGGPGLLESGGPLDLVGALTRGNETPGIPATPNVLDYRQGRNEAGEPVTQPIGQRRLTPDERRAVERRKR